MGNDIKQMQTIMPAIDDEHDRYLFLQSFCTHLLESVHGFEFIHPFMGDERTPSLTDVVAATHGKPLDKTPTISAWCKRPLDQYQQEYAALDAHALH